MAASIFGERFFGRRQPAWHRIGTVMDDDMTVSQAMKHVDVGFEIYTTPTYIYIEEQLQTGVSVGRYVSTESLGSDIMQLLGSLLPMTHNIGY